jgi:cytochrome c-type biogenesis protein CcsB
VGKEKRMMAIVFGKLALAFTLLATGGLIVFIISQKKPVYRCSYRLLLAGFASLTLQIGFHYHALGVAPVLTLKSALSFFAWTILGAYLVFHLKFRLMVLGSFIAPLVAILLIISTAIPSAEVAVNPIFRSFWLTVHVSASFVGNGMFALTFMAGIMYLTQERQIKKKKFGSLYSRLPSLATLDSINHYSLIWGFPFLTLGMITGAIYAQYALGSYWRWDPKEVWSLITWLFYAVLLHERLAVGWRGRRAALMAIVGFAVLSFTFVGASLWLSDYHSFRSLGGYSDP